MVEPKCEKCGGWLEHCEDSLWICKKCGREYLYVKDLTDDEMILRRISRMIKGSKDSIMSESERLELCLSELNRLARDQHSLSGEGEGLAAGYQKSLCLLQKYFEEVNEFVEDLRRLYACCGGGHFESLDLDLDKTE